MDPAFRFLSDDVPDELLALGDRALLRELARPTLVRVPGTGAQPPRAVVTLLHGDESTGPQAMLRVLRHRRRVAAAPLPFDLYVVFGNVEAALHGPGFAHRFLDDQEDFNRVWGLPATTPQRRAAAGILAELRAAGLESVVDVHNNTGDNPFYAIVTRLTPETLNLATLFTTTLLRWDLQAATLMEALHDDCATIAVECGLPGRPESLAFAVDALRRYLGEGPLPTDRVVRDLDLLGELRKVTVRPDVRFRFGGDLAPDTDLVLEADADVHNFVAVDAGHVLGRTRDGAPLPVCARAADGRDVTDEHFAVVEGRLVVTRPSTPVMMTRTVEATRKDCLFYLASALPPPVV
ncbi:succinylglutamate desuccinylase/aspartoacylase family protein [Egicoccus halophilus]|uniref:succinylglutamate desuccinylase/aspartoacylase family protein n=1 Tax=Egicoccus halophilus TaxID=1670830 RepID=UPI0010304E23|nr:succinylglutamate desuccinylase/aspartoacylase family protein [Egicoccus halophilus]